MRSQSLEGRAGIWSVPSCSGQHVPSGSKSSGCAPRWGALHKDTSWSRSMISRDMGLTECKPDVQCASVEPDLGGTRSTPWSMSWQLNERYTAWSKTNQGRLVALIASGNFSSMKEFDSRMMLLCNIVPDFVSSIAYVYPPTLVAILRTPDCGADVMLLLREKLGNLSVDVSKVICAYPVALTWSREEMIETLNKLIHVFGSLSNVSAVMNQSPWILDIEKVMKAMGSLQRLLGLTMTDAAKRVVDQPNLLDSCVQCSDTLGKSAYFDDTANSWRD